MGKEFIAVTGATASGKSALAIELAKRLNGEIISCDSMQIYRTMDIGTAKPSSSELACIPHHMVDIADPGDEFSAGDWCSEAGKAIDSVIAKGKTPIVCGGTFLYLDSLISSYTRSETERDEGLRRSLEAFALENGNAALHKMLFEIDPKSAEAIHENNVKRVIRAIEIYRTSGKTKSEWDSLSKLTEPAYRAHIIVIDYINRNILYDRINRRVEMMLEEGLESEARKLYDEGFLENGKTASQAIGYKEFYDYFENKATLEETIEKIKKSSRNYAKRQLTWLKRYKDAIRLYPDSAAPALSSGALADRAICELRLKNIISEAGRLI